MALSREARDILIVAMANRAKANEVADAIDAASNTADGVAIAANTAAIVVNAADIATNLSNIGNYYLEAIMVAVTADTTTDATTLGVVVGDWVIEVDVAGGGVTGNGVIAVDDTFAGAVTIGSILIHLKPVV